MKITTEKPEPGVTTLTVEVPSEEFDRAVEQAWRRVGNRVNIPGFRRGKAPRMIVERHVGPAAVDEEALRRLLPERYDAAVEEVGIAPIEQPQFDIVQVERGKPLVFKATVSVRPTVQLGDYKEISVERERVELSTDEVDRVLDRLRETQAQWIPVEDRGLEMGDQALVDLKIEFPPEDDQPGRTSDRKDVEVVLGENGYPEGFDQQLLGARPGETREFPLTWQLGPAAGEPGGEEGKEPDKRTASFTVSVKDIKRKQLPDLDDAFAKSLGEHETLAELIDDVRARLREEALRSARVGLENKVVDAAVDKATFEIPQRLVDAETEALAQERRQTLAQQGITLERYLQLSGQTEENWRSELATLATRQIKARVLLDEIVERDALQVTPDEIDEEIDRTAESYGPQADDVRRQLMTPDARRRVETSLRRHKAIEQLVEAAGGYTTEVVEAAPSAQETPSAQEPTVAPEPPSTPGTPAPESAPGEAVETTAGAGERAPDAAGESAPLAAGDAAGAPQAAGAGQSPAAQ